MRMRALATLALLAIAAAAASGQDFTPAMKKAILDFRLDTKNSKAIIACQTQLSRLMLGSPERMKQFGTTMKKPLEDQIAIMEKDGEAAAILKANRLGAREYTVGLVALRAAAWSVRGKPGPLKGLESSKNVAFLKANPAILEEFEKGESGGFLR